MQACRLRLLSRLPIALTRNVHLVKPFIGLEHLKKPMSDTEDKHVDKKPRLDSAGPSKLPLRLELEMEKDDIPEPEPEASLDGGMSMLGALTSIISKQLSMPKAPKKYKTRPKALEPYSKEDIIWREVTSLLGQEAVDKAMAEGTTWQAPYERQEQVELVVSCLSTHGDSLAIAPSPQPWVVVTPFALPGETIRAKIYRHSHLFSYADLVEIVTPNPKYRDDSRVQCKYFGQCSGCQYQMLSYDMQLELKRDVIVKAYNAYSEIPPSSVPSVLPTIGSPLQYNYRTKITPHFEMHSLRASKLVPTEGIQPDWLAIGYNKIGTRFPLDIEECPIATPALNERLGIVRQEIIDKLHTYKRGVSLLLRESLDVQLTGPSVTVEKKKSPGKAISQDTTEWVDAPEPEKKICVTDHKVTVRERVGDTKFEYNAGSFFQNNNSVLVPLTSYVRDAIFPADAPPDPRPTHLVDAYCGSGLFALTLAPSFAEVAGIELSQDSIEFAKRNARLNKVDHYCKFLAGDAVNIFEQVEHFPRDKTVLIIDPPRRGSDDRFISQLIRFACQTVVYVSCNVHTQARDVGVILRRSEAEMGGRKYVIASLRGFDLFPQTAHVESVAVLQLVPS